MDQNFNQITSKYTCIDYQQNHLMINVILQTNNTIYKPRGSVVLQSSINTLQEQSLLRYRYYINNRRLTNHIQHNNENTYLINNIIIEP